MNFGLSNSDYILLQKLVIEPLKKKGAELYAFGSRVTGKNHPFSDIDLLVVSPGGANLQHVLSSVKEDIEESTFPIKVDIVQIENLADSYRDSVNRCKVKL